MKLLKIEFHGFKSFADSSDVRFHDGMTAIVGPNGCGKSNISDALRWVLGEQKPSAIRGSRMEEAIFQGTDRRKPINRAEVTLHLSNTDGVLPVPYSEVRIGRTLYRGGEGEYRLNGTVCRLRDIQDLCRDTGLGTNAYAIIESRMIDAILSERAEERRAMFEEAAGIGRYKERRRVAMRRLDEADGDLARVQDLIGEVQKKVRSLARQRGRARRYFEYRERKLALELAIARADIERFDARRSEIETELRRLDDERANQSASQRTGEAEYEEIRARLSELEHERAENARQLMQTRDRLAERERERLLAEERERQGRARLGQIGMEREDLAERQERRSAAVRRLEADLERRTAELGGVREVLASREAEIEAIASRRQELERAAAGAEEQLREYRERRADLEARIEGARADAEELDRRIGEARSQLEGTRATLEGARREASQAREGTDVAGERVQRLAADLEERRGRLSELEARRDEARAEQAAIRERLRAAEARIETLVPLTSGEDGLNAAVRAALDRADDLGILDLLGRALRVEPRYAEGLEAYLGPYLQGLIVRNSAAADHVRRWFLEDYDGPGGLILLPLDRLPDAGPALPSGVECDEPAAAWARFLLREVELVEGGDRTGGGGPRVGRRESIDAHGIVRLGQPHEGAGLLARRAELEALRDRRTELQEELRRVLDDVRRMDAEVAAAKERLSGAEQERRSADEKLARLRAGAEAARERVERLAAEEASAGERLERLRGELERVRARAGADRAALDELAPAESSGGPAPEELDRVRAEWESARESVAEQRLAEARAAAAFERVERELESERSGLAQVEERLAALADEESGLNGSLAELAAGMEEAARELEELFERRTEAEGRASEMDRQAEEMRERASELEARLRQAQRREREHSERRHELELELSEVRAELRRARERLEDEWGRPFDSLVQEVEPAEGEPDALAAELSDVAERIARLEPVNMLAEQEYQEESERLEFLQSQRADLVEARNDLRETIRRINETASRELVETLERIRENFDRTFQTLFEGGRCDIWLEDPDDPLDSPIEISASPSGKKTQRIHLLSGGERALTALALLFAIYLVKPSPFCVLDEVDAPLDETNIRRFVAMLEEFKKDVQFIVITHNPVTIEAADWIYGVTMEEPGVSKIVGVEFGDLPRGAVA